MVEECLFEETKNIFYSKTGIYFKNTNLVTFCVLFVINDKLRVIAKSTLRDFWKKHGDSEQQLKA